VIVGEGIYVPTYGEGVTERGKYVNVWMQLNGNWRIEANIWNADPPQATQTTSPLRAIHGNPSRISRAPAGRVTIWP